MRKQLQANENANIASPLSEKEREGVEHDIVTETANADGKKPDLILQAKPLDDLSAMTSKSDRKGMYAAFEYILPVSMVAVPEHFFPETTLMTQLQNAGPTIPTIW